MNKIINIDNYGFRIIEGPISSNHGLLSLAGT